MVVRFVDIGGMVLITRIVCIFCCTYDIRNTHAGLNFQTAGEVITITLYVVIR